MVSRRPHGSGSLVERPAGSGQWYFRYSIGPDPVTGKPRRRAVTFRAKSKSAAQSQARAIVASTDTAPVGSSMSVSELLEEWMRFQHSRDRSPVTVRGYRSLIDLHITPALGAIKTSELSAHQLDSLYAKCSKEGKSPRTIRNIHNVIGAACNQAVRWGWLERSPTLRATLPTAPVQRLTVPSVEIVRNLISTCQQESEILGAFAFLSAVTGCRRGEVAALRWNSIQSGVLVIKESAYSVKGEIGIKSTKSGRERAVHLDPVVQTWLAHWRERCEDQALDWGVSLPDNGFILSSRPDGSQFVNLDAISRGVKKAARQLGLGDVHLHSLRHFAATELLAAGVSANDAAEMLGHADPALTLRVYAHATADRQKAAARVLGGLVDGPLLLEPLLPEPPV